MFNYNLQDVHSRECAPNYESQAATINKVLKANINFVKAFQDFAENGSMHQLSNADIHPLLAIIGGLSLEIIKLEERYKLIIDKLESSSKNEAHNATSE